MALMQCSDEPLSQIAIKLGVSHWNLRDCSGFKLTHLIGTTDGLKTALAKTIKNKVDSLFGIH